MRSDREVLDLILATARADTRVRAVILSGSRADPALPPDALRDFDVVFVVDEVAPFRADPGRWRVFGEAAIVQFPDAMQGAPPRTDGGFAVLMQFVDGHRIDLTLLPASFMPRFEHDGPALVLHDPDGLVPPPEPGAAHHRPEPPTREAFADVCNELWWVAPYVAKGLLRGELTYARHHLDTVLRAQLMTMLDWYVLVASGGERGPGKYGRFLRNELPDALWTLLEDTYADADSASAWGALEALTALFRQLAVAVAERHGFVYPTGDDERVTALLRRMRQAGPVGVPVSVPRSRWPTPSARSASQAAILGELPDLFAWPDGRRVATLAEWRERADAWRESVVDLAYGGLPPPPEELELELRSETRLRQLPGAPRWQSLRLRLGLAAAALSFELHLLLPDAPASVPAVAYGDGCWRNLSDQTLADFAARGFALALFDRTEVAPDAAPPADRRGGLFDLLPERSFGALSAWAWGYGRVVDALLQLPEVDSERLGVTGFSRGGKAALLAGATDARIALVHAHASGAGGAAPYRYLGEGAETLDVARVFSTWFGPRLAPFRGREHALPFDQHVLLACVAPRALLLTVGVDDRWANPEGTLQAAWAAGQAYRFVGAPDALTVALREGGHAHTPIDWERLLEFAAWRWLDGPEPAGIGSQPFAGLRPAFGWRAPGAQAG
jgi:aminoglycoside 6-adenylyltransferase